MEANNVIAAVALVCLTASHILPDTPAPTVPAIEAPAPTIVPLPAQMDAVYRTVYGEARSQSVHEIEAIVHVIVNRWEKGWADTLEGVATQCNRDRTACQFSVWNTDDPNLPVITGNLDGRKDFVRVKEIVDRVVMGRLNYWIIDPTAGGDHYWHGHKRPWWSRGHQPNMIGEARIINIRG